MGCVLVCPCQHTHTTDVSGHSEVSDHGLRSVSTSSHGSEAYLYKSSLQEKTTGASVFTMAELSKGTGDFSQSNKIGQGGFGLVYRCKLRDGRTVAIKRAKKGVLSNGGELAIKLLKKSEQGVTEFLNEIVLLTSVKHKNLVTLKGCCLHDVQRLLVYEFVENQNLAEVLWGDNYLQLDWPRRLNICVGIARGLSYLHEDSHQRIIHRDIKAPNILLDKQFNAKIADFGLARLFPDDESHMTTFHIAGTRGYLAPEYATLGQLSDKVDVYSFGILLLEIISGRKNIDFTLSIDKIYLLEWAWFLHENKMLQNLIDQNLNINNNLESQIQHVINVALLCVHTIPTRRPSMMHVLAMLLGEKKVEVAFRESLGSKKNYSFMSEQSNQSSKFANKEVQPTLYSYNTLKTSTKNFHQSNKLGEGGFGIVYKGVLSNGGELAIKLLKKSEQGVTEFLNEIVLLTSVKHKNLVTLKGCCLHDVQRLLVYEFVENQNLAEVLWGGNYLQLDWPRRLNICVGIARGLSYLHEDSHQRIIHRDIKAPNILLDKQFNAKIADFGLARLFPDDESHMTTFHIAGTRGYLAPEYATLGQLSDKVDVYSFGILLLEIISGRKNIDFTLSIDKIYLLEWAWFLHENKMLQNLIDQNLNINNNLESQIQHVINVALLCVHTIPTRRPSMMHVLAMLLGEKRIAVPANAEQPWVFGSQDLGFRTSKALHPTVVLSSSRHFSLRPPSLFFFSSLFSASTATFLCVQWSQIETGPQTAETEPPDCIDRRLCRRIKTRNCPTVRADSAGRLKRETLLAVTMASAHNSSPSPESFSIALPFSCRSLFNRSVDPFCSGEYPAVFLCVIPLLLRRVVISSLTYSPPLSVCTALTFFPFCSSKIHGSHTKVFFSLNAFPLTRTPETNSSSTIFTKFSYPLCPSLLCHSSGLSTSLTSKHESFQDNPGWQIANRPPFCSARSTTSFLMNTWHTPRLKTNSAPSSVALLTEKRFSTTPGTNITSWRVLTRSPPSIKHRSSTVPTPVALSTPLLPNLISHSPSLSGSKVLNRLLSPVMCWLAPESRNHCPGSESSAAVKATPWSSELAFNLSVCSWICNCGSISSTDLTTSAAIKTVTNVSNSCDKPVITLIARSSGFTSAPAASSSLSKSFALLTYFATGSPDSCLRVISSLFSCSFRAVVLPLTPFLAHPMLGIWRGQWHKISILKLNHLHACQQMHLLLSYFSHATEVQIHISHREFANKEVQPTLYSYNILKTTTRDFHRNNKLGEGGFGIVYKGVFSNGGELAIKLLKKSEQGVTEFLNEIVLLTNVKHKKLMTLKGCCLHGVQRLLVYEFVENKNLAEVLWGDNYLQLDWPRRFNICVGIARGLSYLHEDSHQRIIHRDIKAPNILLDKQFNAKIADFGLARLFPDDESHMTTFHIAGTRHGFCMKTRCCKI
ncbi:unnamed protein product [Sphagnum jensenii]|uniref:Protein kinase domain-containing protein n=1 Tax=Sphagnum jensenii TaxID=128206 RepID=A0ABP0XCC0_9BRYO